MVKQWVGAQLEGRTVAELDRQAAARGISRSEAMRRALDRWLEEALSEEESRLTRGEERHRQLMGRVDYLIGMHREMERRLGIETKGLHRQQDHQQEPEQEHQREPGQKPDREQHQQEPERQQEPQQEDQQEHQQEQVARPATKKRRFVEIRRDYGAEETARQGSTQEEAQGAEAQGAEAQGAADKEASGHSQQSWESERRRPKTRLVQRQRARRGTQSADQQAKGSGRDTEQTSGAPGTTGGATGQRGAEGQHEGQGEAGDQDGQDGGDSKSDPREAARTNAQSKLEKIKRGEDPNSPNS